MCREFYTVVVGYVKIFNTEEKMEAAVLLPKKTSLAASAASWRRELPALSGDRYSFSVPECHPGLRSHMFAGYVMAVLSFHMIV